VLRLLDALDEMEAERDEAYEQIDDVEESIYRLASIVGWSAPNDLLRTLGLSILLDDVTRVAEATVRERDEARRLAEQWRDECSIHRGFSTADGRQHAALPWEDQ
jgi:hypothetical protein